MDPAREQARRGVKRAAKRVVGAALEPGAFVKLWRTRRDRDVHEPGALQRERQRTR